MKTLKPIINALLILLMAIYGLAMLALLILPFVNVANLFPRCRGSIPFWLGLLAGRRATICLLSCLDLAPS